MEPRIYYWLENKIAEVFICHSWRLGSQHFFENPGWLKLNKCQKGEESAFQLKYHSFLLLHFTTCSGSQYMWTRPRRTLETIQLPSTWSENSYGKGKGYDQNVREQGRKVSLSKCGCAINIIDNCVV